MRFGTPLADELTNLTLEDARSAIRSATIEQLSVYGVDGFSGYHAAAEARLDLPLDKLDESVLLLKNKLGETPLHLICKHPWTPTAMAQDLLVANLPLKYMTDRTLFAKDNNGDTPFHNLVASGGFDLLPKHQRTLKNLLRVNNNGETGLHKAAQTGKLRSLSPSFLTQENLQRKTKTGNTVFHDVMRGGEFSTLKSSLVTLKNLTLADEDFTTPLHCGSLAQVPRHFITQETLMLTCNGGGDGGWTVLHGAALRGDLQYIPLELLTPDNLTKVSMKGSIPLEYHINQGLGVDCLPIYKPGWVVKNEVERRKWLKLIETYSMPEAESVSKDMSHLEKDGAWSDL